MLLHVADRSLDGQGRILLAVTADLSALSIVSFRCLFVARRLKKLKENNTSGTADGTRLSVIISSGRRTHVGLDQQ